MKPLGTNVLIKVAEVQKTTSSGILLGVSAKKPLQGEIIAVSDGTEDYKMKTEVGQTVLYHDNQGVKIEHEGQDCLLIDERSCIAIL